VLFRRWRRLGATGKCRHCTHDVTKAERDRLHGRVLVVDDEGAVAEFMRELLQTWGWK